MDAADYLCDPRDADHDGAAGGSIDALDQLSDERLRAKLKESGRILHHKTGRAKLLEALREAA